MTITTKNELATALNIFKLSPAKNVGDAVRQHKVVAKMLRDFFGEALDFMVVKDHDEVDTEYGSRFAEYGVNFNFCHANVHVRVEWRKGKNYLAVAAFNTDRDIDVDGWAADHTPEFAAKALGRLRDLVLEETEDFRAEKALQAARGQW